MDEGEWLASCCGRFTLGKEPQYPLNRSLDRPHGWCGGWIIFSCWDLNPGSSSPWPSHYTDYAILTPVFQSCTLQKHTVFRSVVNSQEFDEKTLGPIVCVCGQHTLFLLHDLMKAMAFGKFMLGCQDLF
jgi:hypothetical protein